MIGIDEVGRGALAGPLVVAGCIFTKEFRFIEELNDSKKLSKSNRERLAKIIWSSAIVKIVEISSTTIDRLGISESITRACTEIVSSMPKEHVIQLDGPYNFLKNTQFMHRSRTCIRADSLFPEVMAASIVAKVYRDDKMQKYAEKFKDYGFDKNVGYGTRYHLQKLKEVGPCRIHRKSFAPMKHYMYE
jgi:ribonuclease HII